MRGPAIAHPLTFYGGGLPHFVDHLAPIWHALPSSIRGDFHARGRGAGRAQQLGIPVVTRVPRNAPLVVVASYEDLRAVRPSPVVLVNHGTGQTYKGDSKVVTHPSYSGGQGREQVKLYLCTSQRDADNCGPNSVVVGVPKLDLWHKSVTSVTLPARPTVAISFHADIHLCPETRWAFPHFQQAIADLVRSDEYNFIGHWHPRMEAFLRPFWSRLPVILAPTFDEVLDQADLYICDNSSTLYEFASTGRPVVVLNAPWYRRHVSHGLRFWDAIPGLEVNEPEELYAGVYLALKDPPTFQQKRESAVEIAYDRLCDGLATERAVKALTELVGNG